MVAYRPLGGGQLRGGSKPGGKETTVLGELARIADGRGATVSQVVLNWLLCQDERVIPIPGATKASHAADNAHALDWRLDDDELAGLDYAVPG